MSEPMDIIEPFAGLAAHSLYAIATQPLIGGRSAPPYSRMGSKSGFCVGVSRAWGLSRRPLRSVWLNDTCQVCQMLWLSYASSWFRDEVSARLSSMVPCRQCLPELVEQALKGEAKPTPDTVEGKDGCAECAGTGVRDCRLWWEELRSAPVPEMGVELGGVGAFLQSRQINLAAIVPNPKGRPYPWGAVRPDSISTVGMKPEDGGKMDHWKSAHGALNPRHTLAQRFATLPPGVADAAAVGAFLQSRNFSQKALGPNGETAGFCPEERHHPAGQKFNGGKAGEISKSPRHNLARNFESLPPGLADAAAVGAFLQSRSFSLKAVGIEGDGWKDAGYCQEFREFPPGHKFCVNDGRSIAQTPRHTLVHRFQTLPGPHNIPITMTGRDAATVLPTGDAPNAVVILDPPYLGVSPVVPPALPAFSLALCARDSSEWLATVDAYCLSRAWAPINSLWVALYEVLRSVGVQSQVAEAVIQRVMVYVVNDLIWCKASADMLLHGKPMNSDSLPLTHDVLVSTLNPSLPLPSSPKGSKALHLGRGFRRAFAEFHVALTDTGAMLGQAFFGADELCAATSVFLGTPDDINVTDVTVNIERHCSNLHKIRTDSLSRYMISGNATTGYASTAARGVVLRLALAWHEAGALVLIHEAEGLDGELGKGWGSRPASPLRGRKSNFWKDGEEREFLTFNKEPIYWPAEQMGLF